MLVTDRNTGTFTDDATSDEDDDDDNDDDDDDDDDDAFDKGISEEAFGAVAATFGEFWMFWLL